MRTLEKEGVFYEHFDINSDITDGESVAELLGVNASEVYKTLVTEAPGRKYYVFVIPVSETLDLKKAAKSCGEKNILMLKQKELFALTGYIHGGCSPVGMKKEFPTYINISALSLEKFFVSAGKVGHQLKISPSDLANIINAKFCDLTFRPGEKR